ncbi:MAG: hypothetical protein IJ341_02300 [Bacteroidales bacterium]|nr:hypothetical protein [Bacteroidales bacterium]
MSKDVKDYKEIQEIQNLQEQLKACNEKIEEQTAEIERLESLCEKIGIANDAKFERICVLQEDLETAKSEAYKEFAYKLKEKARVEDDDYSPNGERSIIEVDDVDNLLIELENKNNDRN